MSLRCHCFVVRRGVTFFLLTSFFSFHSEESYAALLHAYAVTKQQGKAQHLFESIQSGELGIRPGPSTYDAYTLACISNRAWGDVLAAYETMKETRIVPSPTTCHGILLATFKTGGKSATKDLLEDFLFLGAQLNQASVLLAMKILAPPEDTEGSESLASARDNLRKISKQDPILQPVSLNLMRSLRKCEIEEERQPSGGLTEHTIQEGRRKAWRSVLRHLLEYANHVEGKK